MAAEHWALNAETVKLSVTGQLLDGWHRLNVIVAAGVTIPLVVVRGLEAEVMQTVDAGAKRSCSDALKLVGEDNTATLAPIARRAVMWENGHRTNTGAIRPTPLAMTEFIETHPELRTSAELAVRLASRERLPASVFGLCHYLFAQLDADAASRFLLRVSDGLNLSEGDPIVVLRDRIARLRVGGGRITRPWA